MILCNKNGLFLFEFWDLRVNIFGSVKIEDVKGKYLYWREIVINVRRFYFF